MRTKYLLITIALSKVLEIAESGLHFLWERSENQFGRWFGKNSPRRRKRLAKKQDKQRRKELRELAVEQESFIENHAHIEGLKRREQVKYRLDSLEHSQPENSQEPEINR